MKQRGKPECRENCNISASRDSIIPKIHFHRDDGDRTHNESSFKY